MGGPKAESTLLEPETQPSGTETEFGGLETKRGVHQDAWNTGKKITEDASQPGGPAQRGVAGLHITQS